MLVHHDEYMAERQGVADENGACRGRKVAAVQRNFPETVTTHFCMHRKKAASCGLREAAVLCSGQLKFFEFGNTLFRKIFLFPGRYTVCSARLGKA